MTEKKKILFIITKGNWGGAQRYVFDLATNLDAGHFDVAVAVGEGTALREKLEARGVRVISLAGLTRDIVPIADLGTFGALLSLFRKERPDIVHLNSAKAGGLGSLAARLMGVPRIIFTVHGFAFYEDRPWIERATIKGVSWLTILFSHATIVLNNRDTASLSEWPCVRGKLRNIKLGIKDTAGFGKQEAFLKLKEAGMAMREGPLIGTIAELHKNKGLRYLVEALALLPKDVSLCIIGNGEERKHLERLARELGLAPRIFFAGFLDGASRFLSAFDLFALPSIKEGTPYVLLEAGAAGLPVVATSVGGIPDVIEDQKTGLLVQPKNARVLMEAIRFLLGHPETAERLGKRLAEKVKAEFSFDASDSGFLEKTSALYS